MDSFFYEVEQFLQKDGGPLRTVTMQFPRK